MKTIKATPLNPGDTVYGQDGQEAEFVTKTGGEYLVRPIYEDDDGPQSGDVQTWRNVFRTPPAPKLDEQTAAAEKRLTEIKAQVSNLERAKYEFDKDEKSRLERIKQHDQLAELDRYLAGEMTHYVARHEYCPDVEIIPVSETIESYPNASGYGLLTLCPRKGWDKKIYWTVTYKVPDRNVYSRTNTVIPCCGEEQARECAVDVLRGYLDQYQAEPPTKWSYPDQLVNCCRRFSVEVPQWLIDGIATSKRASLELTIADQRKKLTEAEAALAAIGADLGGAA